MILQKPMNIIMKRKKFNRDKSNNSRSRSRHNKKKKGHVSKYKKRSANDSNSSSDFFIEVKNKKNLKKKKHNFVLDCKMFLIKIIFQLCREREILRRKTKEINDEE